MASMHAEEFLSTDRLVFSSTELRPAQVTASLRSLLADGRGIRGRNVSVCVSGDQVLGEALRERLDLLAALYPGLQLSLEQDGEPRSFVREDGLSGYLQEQLRDAAGRLPAVARFSAELPAEQGGVLRAEVALQWLTEGEGSVLSLVNDAPTPGHGTPLLGFVAGLSRALEEEGLDRNLLHYGMPALTKKRVLSGVAAILRLEHPSPLYSSPSRSALSSRDALALFEQVTFRKVRALCKETPGLIEALLARALGVPVGDAESWRGRARLGAVA